jgi:hypothetical protein
MLKRVLLLCLGIWLIAASGLSAHAGPCGLKSAKAEMAPKAAAHDHCDMMAATGAEKPEAPAETGQTANCCCPAVLSALAVPVLPEVAVLAFALPGNFPADARAPSRNLIPETPPPKA